MINLLYWLLAIIMFGVLVMLHELGHFLAARATGVPVAEFAIGFGPKLFSRTGKKNGVIFSLRALPFGIHLTMMCITECFATDVFAYLIGSRYGKRKLLPAVSPNKTLLGSAAGMAAAVAFCLLYALVLSKLKAVSVNYGLLLVYAVIANVLAQFGDLSMSVVKRITGIKDFGTLIPGHGGLLDRFDSLIFVVPFTLIFFWVTGGFFC